jgi:predicted ATP-grasp superfamily ATP-dependent carboligase
MPNVLTIVGASARAAAFSARAAGFEPWCADLFADVDLQAIATVERVNDYPAGLSGFLHSSPDGPWMYTGALENHPDLIDELARLRPLYGNRGGVLRRARDPIFWSRYLAESGLPAPRISLSTVELPRDGSWMRKPLRSANGHGVSLWTPEVAARANGAADADDWYFQERIAGIPIAAIFVATEGEAAILGVTQQLVGGDWNAALSAIAGETDLNRPSENRQAGLFSESPFRYTGSVGPLVLEDRHYHTIKRSGSAFASACGLVGLFGVDAILNAQNVWPVEFNPRYTASIEVLERASALRTRTRRPRRLLSIEWHEAACCFRQLLAPLGQSAEVTAGKLIYYARRDGRFSRAAARWAVERNLAQSRPAVADIPATGTTFHPGQPILTLFADGPSADSVCVELSRAAEDLEQHLC